MSVEPDLNGALKDPEDERDYSAGAIYASMGVTRNAYPKTLDLRVRLPKVKSQGSRGTCAAHAATVLKEWQENVDNGYEGRFSPEFVYFYRENKPNVGMFSRDVMKILATRGCCVESDLPYSSTDGGAPTEIPADVTKRALQYTIVEYARVNTIEELKTALYQNGPCYIAFPVYKERPEFWRKQSPDEARSGGHAVAVVGYNASGFILRNSWGKSWNKDGHVVYPYSDFGAHWDIWTAIDMEGSPRPPPEPKNEAKCCIIN
jgi:C1A family cysteine protease